MGDPEAPNGSEGNLPVLTALGVISGTSMDAVDVALITTDGAGIVRRGLGRARAYTDRDRAVIRRAMTDVIDVGSPGERTDAMAEAEDVVTAAHCEAVAAYLDAHTTQPDVIGWHGQTILHAPNRGVTVQLGDGSVMAERFGVTVVHDLRAADVAAGGEGAPLVPVYHRALVRAAGLPQPALIINLGGVANVTFVDGDTLIAFDTGPASAMIDDAVATVGLDYDEGGAIAACGRVNFDALKRLFDHPYFDAPPPKSLDRDAFDPAPVAGLSLQDRVATLTRFSAEAIGRGVSALPARPVTVVAAGGGTHNATMMAAIADVLGVTVARADDAGFSSDFMEAEAFAYLAVRALAGLPLTMPGTTGVPSPTTGGRVCRPPRAP